MIHTIDNTVTAQGEALRAMFEARKQVFVDLLKWDLPVLGGTWELDRFDDAHATYIVVTGQEGRHQASARLLETTRPHILGELFPQLCESALPSAPDIYEITRFCLDRRLRAAGRREARNQLVSALARHALASGITSYSGVAEMAWFQQILSFGWRCEPLGLPRICNGAMLAAFSITIDEETPGRLAAAGIWRGSEGERETASRAA